MTQRELIARYLDHAGYVCLAKTSKRWTYHAHRHGYNRCYYLGANGSFRVGRTVATSIPVADRFKTFALAFNPEGN
jgi:hypothetical protein